MLKGAVMIENRLTDAQFAEVIQKHVPFLPDDWKVTIIRHKQVTSMQDYNQLLTSLSFWESMPYDKVLIFQHDSGLLREGIEEFLEWDYVGAPWRFQQHGGNGGLSLRSKEAMIKVIKAHPWRGMLLDGNEDLYFCNRMKEMGLNMAPREVCSKFSVETIFTLGSLGYHAMDKYLFPVQVSKVLHQYE